MGKDTSWKDFFSDNERYADIINGIGCNGQQYVKAEDLHEADSALKGKTQDLIRKIAFGINFAMIGIENQENIDYRFPLRNMHYEVNQYQKQASQIRKRIRKERQTTLSPGEYMYGFKKESRFYPVVTFVLYSGEEPWDGPMTLHDIINFTDIPEAIKAMTANYSINLIDIRRMEDTSKFKTDVKYIFDFIRYSHDADALCHLMLTEPYYQQMDEDAYEVMHHYGNLHELNMEEIMQKNKTKEGKMNVAKGILDWMESSKNEGIEQNRLENARNLIGLLSDEIIAEKIGLPLEKVKELHKAIPIKS